MVQISSLWEEKEAARKRLLDAAARSRTLVAPVDWGPYHPFLQNPFLDAAETGTWETFLIHELVTLLKQAGLRLGRGALEAVYTTGVVDVGNRYAPLGKEQNTIKGLLQIVKHAMVLADAQRCVAMDLPGARFAGRYETAADLLHKWCRKGISVQEMFQGMALEVAYTDTFPYTHLHAWEKVHIAMRNLPGVSVSAPGRMSLTRLVFGWLKASRPLGREHELELMNQIDVYAEVEEKFGRSEDRIADLYEVKDFYHKQRILNSKLEVAAVEPEILELAPTLAVLGGALPRTYLLGSKDREIIHYQVAQDAQDAELRIEFADDPYGHGENIEWHE